MGHSRHASICWVAHRSLLLIWCSLLISHSGSLVTEESFYVTLFVRLKNTHSVYMSLCVSGRCPRVLPTVTEMVKDKIVLGNQPFLFCLTCCSFVYCLHVPWNVVHRYDLMV